MPVLTHLLFLISKMNKILRLIIGTVFMLSALLKASDSAAFADLMGEYGAGWFGYAAPILIVVELLLGLLFLFDISPDKISLLTIIFIIGVSSIYLYGLLEKGITNCGCFGPLTWLNSRPWITFVRNGILLCMLVPSLFTPKQEIKLKSAILICMAIISSVVMFMCGYSFHGAKCMKKDQKPFLPFPVSETKLPEYIAFHPDSTYFVYAFSYGCPFCLNSIGNVSQYESMGMADKVIGLAVKDIKKKERFNSLFHQVDFEIREISDYQMYQITSTLPAAYLIRHDSVVKQQVGLVVSPALLIH